MVAWTKAPRFALLAMVQPDASGVAPSVPVSCHGVASPVALSGSAGTMIAQLVLAAATGVVGVGDGQGVEVAVGAGAAVVVGVAVAVVPGEVGAGVTGAVVTGAVVTGAMVTGAMVTGAVLTGAVLTGAVLTGAVVAGPVVAGAVATGAVRLGTAIGKCRCRPLGTRAPVAAADVAVAPAIDVAGVTDVVAEGETDTLGEGETQALARFALLEALSVAAKWGAIRSAIPTARTTTMSPAIAARRRRGRSSNCR
jgi:hypothetical protein